MSSNIDGENKIILHQGTDIIAHIPWDRRAIFLHRINRFVGLVDISEGIRTKAERMHIHDPGRLEELLFPGNEVLLKKAPQNGRKTSWDLIAASYRGKWVLVNSSYHSDLAQVIITQHGIFGQVDGLEREIPLGESRIDFLLHTPEGDMAVEVKGCTLAHGRVALFPDAPTTRGTRHMEELIRAVEMGMRAGVLFLVFRHDAECFSPHRERDPDFARAFYRAMDSGVEFRAVKLIYNPDDGSVIFTDTIPLCGDDMR